MALGTEGTVAFLMTDIVGSTRLWEADPRGMAQSVERQEALVRAEVEREGGQLVKHRGEGDSAFAVFQTASAAVKAAVGIQERMLEEEWPSSGRILIRIAVHAGEAQMRADDFFGPSVNRCARIRSLAAGGQILVSDVVQRLARDGGERLIGFRDLGTHRLKDLLQPEHLWQISKEGLPSEFPTLKSLERTPNNLPIQLTGFIGREADIGLVSEAILKNRHVSLLGPGGSGKTRLALQVAAEVLEEFPEGVWFVPLAAVSNADALAEEVAQAARIVVDADEKPLDAICRTIAEQRALLVLDNCEQIVEQAREFAKRVLTKCPKVAVLATSRQALRSPGEVAIPVLPLSLPSETDERSLEAMEASEAVRLLLQRAQARTQSFRLTQANASPIARICRKLDGLPLAIELAAPKLRILKPEELLARLQESLTVLRAGAEHEEERHRTIEEAIAWSYRLLSPLEALLFRRLGVFAGGWSLDAAESVCGDKELPAAEIVHLLEALVDKSMVAVRFDSEATRYDFLESLKAYAAARLAEDASDERDARRRLFSWLSSLASEAEARGDAPAEFTAKLVSERDNFASAIAWGEHARVGGELLTLVVALTRYWSRTNRTGQLRDARQRLAAAIDQAPDAPLDLRGTANLLMGSRAMAESDFKSARLAYEAALSLFEEAKRPDRAIAAINNLALVDIHEERYEAARRLLHHCKDYYKEFGPANMYNRVLANLGGLESDLGHDESALPLLTEAIELNRAGEGSDKLTLLALLGHLADIRFRQGEFKEVMELAAESLHMSFEFEDDFRSALMLNLIAMVAARMTDGAFGCRLLGAARTLMADAGHKPTQFELAQISQVERAVFDEVSMDVRDQELAAGARLNRSTVYLEAREWLAQRSSANLD